MKHVLHRLRGRSNRRIGAAAKTLIGVFAVALILFVITSAGFSLRDREQNRAAVASELGAAADAAGEELAGWFTGRVLLVELANDLIAKTGTHAGREQAIRTATVNRSFEELYFGAQANGGLIRSRPIDTLPPGYDPRTRPWYMDAARRGGTVVTDPYLSAGNRGPVVTIAVPLIEAGRLVGVTASDFRLDAVLRILTAHRETRGRTMMLVDGRGRILIHKRTTLLGQPLSALFDRPLTPAADTVQHVRQNGVEKLVRFRPVRGLPSRHPWYVAIVADEQVETASLSAAFLRSAETSAIIITAMMAGFLLILALVVLRPLKAVTDSIGEIAAGRFDAAIPHLGRNDEIGDVARAVAAFRDNAREVERLRAQEDERIARAAAERAAMMGQLQAAFGVVVDAASRGDLERRVALDFNDAALNGLAASVNALIATIARGLGESCAVLSAIARSDLTRRVQGDYHGAFDAMKRDSNAVAGRLGEMVGQSQATARQLRAGIADLTGGTRRLAGRTAEQSAAMRGTATEVQVIAEIAARHATDVDAASRQARDATAAGQEGGRVMREASSAMKRMTDTSERVVGVADVLDEIARQTSLVALNAGIEAQRAGAAGRTFGVVADEVRRLAQHATAASRDVKALIATAVDDVNHGARMVAMVEVELTAMLRALTTSSGLLDGIASGSLLQAQSIRAVERSVARFDEAVQDDLALVTDLEAITRRTEASAAELEAIVDAFTLAPPQPRGLAA